jgi:acyl-CoA hydrolase|tara:strand:+ start:303 stop:938 length:636 start_codon:yes stop_codon:yes gene_type:complete
MQKWRPHWIIISVMLATLCACEKSPQFDALAPGATVLAFGDSVTYGVGANSGEDFPTLLAAETGWNVINAGVSGDTADKAKHRIGALLAKHQPRLVIVELGGNDFLRRRSMAAVKQDLRQIIDQSLNSGATTVLISVPALSVFRATMGTLADAPIYAELAEETSVVLVSDLFSGVLSDDNLKADKIHPNSRGYEVFTAGLVTSLTTAGLLL